MQKNTLTKTLGLLLLLIQSAHAEVQISCHDRPIGGNIPPEVEPNVNPEDPCRGINPIVPYQSDRVVTGKLYPGEGAFVGGGSAALSGTVAIGIKGVTGPTLIGQVEVSFGERSDVLQIFVNIGPNDQESTAIFVTAKQVGSGTQYNLGSVRQSVGTSYDYRFNLEFAALGSNLPLLGLSCSKVDNYNDCGFVVGATPGLDASTFPVRSYLKSSPRILFGTVDVGSTRDNYLEYGYISSP